ncbi:hypothetical protein R9X47_28370 [Wukongibacter baidiensis]|uniref:hypothetical protein n=1 Tax=Wukongibacter baidiensis TaxID=1723361 RepID=UPI003D7F52D0
MQGLNLEEKNDNKSYSTKDFNDFVEFLKFKYLSLWWSCKTDFPQGKTDISFLNKFTNERKVEGFRKKLRSELRQTPKEEFERTDLYDKIISLIAEIENGIIGYENRCLDFFVEKGYIDVTDEFLKEATIFDPDIEVYDIFQAIRNVWIMNSIQILLDTQVRLTPSIFSYSMLYPYSDNYLDNTDIIIKEKIDFNNKFRKCLSGKEVEASNSNEKHVFDLVRKIEDEFPRDRYPKVFESLLSIHSAQEKSLAQQKGKSLPHENDILGISFEKGGTSVLTDGFLIKGELLKEEAVFMFGYGVFLQLIDDLQDVQVDLENQHMTVFSQVAGKWPLDILVNKLFWFIESVLESCDTFDSQDSPKLKKVIHDSCIIMILEAISKNKKMFSRKYIKEIEKISMFRFSYYKKLKMRFQRDYSSKEIQSICKILSKKSLGSKFSQM